MDKKEIINLFNNNVRGKKDDLVGYNSQHDGKAGSWLEHQMGIQSNNKNEADLFGFEMKSHTSSKTTFGDWSPDLAVWKRKLPEQILLNSRFSRFLGYFGLKLKNPYVNIQQIDRDTEFLVYFGKPNKNKNGRHSWSGEPAPKISGYNKFGQILRVDKKSNILACYSYSKDTRKNKATLIPENFQYNNIILARWSKNVLKPKLERKFNDKGWFKCYKDPSGTYTSIGFGEPITYKSWIKLVKKGVVIFDSGMSTSNKRPRASWRANNNFWNSLVTEKY